MQIENFTFGQISIDGASYEHDVVKPAMWWKCRADRR